MVTPSTQLSLLLVISLFTLTLSAPLQTCKGLVLQGGSDKGAYQAGVLQGLFQKLGAEAVDYDVISGITIGAVNAAWMTQFGKGQEEVMIDELLNFWLTIKASDVYKDWEGGVIQGLLFEPSMYNTGPGMEYLKTHITQAPQRYIGIGTANANNGGFKVFNNFNETLSAEDMLQSVMAAMGISGVFPYIEINESTYFDGSPLKSTDVASVVNQCRALNGGNDSNIVIDIIMLSGKNLSTADIDGLNALQVLVRTLELTSYNNAMIGLVRAKETFPNVQFRYVISPSTPIPGSDMPISFDHDEIVNMINMGNQDAAAAIAAGPGVSFDEYVEFARAKKGLKRTQPESGSALKEKLVKLNEMFSELKAQRERAESVVV